MSLVKKIVDNYVQGDNSEIWIIEEWDGKEMVNKYHTKENPNKKIDLKDVDLTTLSNEQISILKTLLK